jgi:rhodanese-related sulfurtransferase
MAAARALPARAVFFWSVTMNFLEKIFGPSVPSITVLALSERLKVGKHPLVLDVRQPDEFRQMRIAGSKLIPLRELYKRMRELPSNREIAIVCATGSSSKSAAKILVKEGYQAFDVSGGMRA